jgi:hypothetical protein
MWGPGQVVDGGSRSHILLHFPFLSFSLGGSCETLVRENESGKWWMWEHVNRPWEVRDWTLVLQKIFSNINSRPKVIPLP